MFGKKRDAVINRAPRSAFSSDFAKKPANAGNDARELEPLRVLPRDVSPLTPEPSDEAGFSSTPSGIVPTSPSLLIQWSDDEKTTVVYERPEDVTDELDDLEVSEQEDPLEEEDLSGASRTSPVDLALVRALIASSEEDEQVEPVQGDGLRPESKLTNTPNAQNPCSPLTLDAPQGRPVILPPPVSGYPERAWSTQRYVPTTRMVIAQRDRLWMVRDFVAILAAFALLAGAFLTVRWALLDRPAVLHVASTPADAAVYLDGELVGDLSPFTKAQISTKHAHILSVQKPGFRTWAQTLTFRPGEVARVRVTLERALALPPDPPAVEKSATLTPPAPPVTITPLATLPPATPWFDVEQQAQDLRGWTAFATETPVVNKTLNNAPPVAIAVHEAELPVAPPNPEESQPTVSAAQPAGEPKPAERPLRRSVSKEETGFLSIDSTPVSEVYVDGKHVGSTPQMNLELAAGRHRVQLVNAEHKLRESMRVRVVPGETTTRILRLSSESDPAHQPW